ncbi:MAG: RNase P subunit p30 family protein [Candidatus Woesearchaeota archaeon]
MHTDIVFPKGNEKEMAETARMLGYDKLLMVYDYMQGFRFPQLDTDVKVCFGLLCLGPQVAKARRLCDFVVVKSNDRSVIEKDRPDMIFGFENEDRIDGLHTRRSGLNQVLCSLLAKNKIVVGLSFKSLLTASPRYRVRLLGRFMQNVALCRKYNVEMCLASFATSPYGLRNPKDLDALSRILGIPASPVPRW